MGAMIKMETRIRELESELDAESRRFGDVTKNLRKSERSIKELTFAADEDRKNHERMQALIAQLQGKVKSYKKQIEEAEEIAALNLAKYRKGAGALGDTEASADANEQAMAMRRPAQSLPPLVFESESTSFQKKNILSNMISEQWLILLTYFFQCFKIYD